jgi:hypothetical protein
VPKFELYKHNDELPVIYVKKLIIMLIQFKFGHFLA